MIRNLKLEELKNLEKLYLKYESVKAKKNRVWKPIDRADNVIDLLREELEAEKLKSNRLRV